MGLDAFLDGMEAATSHLELLSAIGHGGWNVQGRRLLGEHGSAEAPSPAMEQLLVLRNHLHTLITGAPGPGTRLPFSHMTGHSDQSRIADRHVSSSPNKQCSMTSCQHQL